MLRKGVLWTRVLIRPVNSIQYVEVNEKGRRQEAVAGGCGRAPRGRPRMQSPRGGSAPAKRGQSFLLRLKGRLLNETRRGKGTDSEENVSFLMFNC